MKLFKTELNFVLLWSTLVFVSTIVGSLISYLLVRNFDDRDYAFGVLLLVFVVGLFIGFGQWTAIMIKSKNIWRWIPATAIGYSVGSFSSFFLLALVGQAFFSLEDQYSDIYQSIQSILMLLVTGIFTGILQWFALGRKGRTSIKWLLVSGLGLVIGFLPTVFPVKDYIPNRMVSSVLVGSVGILLFALLTGIGAVQLIVSPEPSND